VDISESQGSSVGPMDSLEGTDKIRLNRVSIRRPYAGLQGGEFVGDNLLCAV
jgi:hypothetical protein